MCFSVFLRLPVITLSSFCSSYPCFMTVIRGQRDQSSPQSSSGEIQGWLWHDESRWVPDQRSSFRHSTLTLTPCSRLFKWRKINRLWFWLDTWKCVVFHVRAITEWMGWHQSYVLSHPEALSYSLIEHLRCLWHRCLEWSGEMWWRVR